MTALAADATRVWTPPGRSAGVSGGHEPPHLMAALLAKGGIGDHPLLDQLVADAATPDAQPPSKPRRVDPTPLGARGTCAREHDNPRQHGAR